MLYSKLPEFRAISEALLGIFPKLSVDYYEGDEYYGKFFCTDDSLVAAAAKFHSVNQRWAWLPRCIVCNAVLPIAMVSVCPSVRPSVTA